MPIPFLIGGLVAAAAAAVAAYTLSDDEKSSSSGSSSDSDDAERRRKEAAKKERKKRERTQKQEAAHEEANIIFGTVIDDNLGDEVRVTVIAAGFEGGPRTRTEVPAIPAKTTTPTTARTGVVGSGQAGSVGRAAANDPLFGKVSASGGDPFAAREEAPRANSVRIDDDDVDVPSFMKR